MLCNVMQCMYVCMSFCLSVCMYVCILALPLCSPVFPANNTVFPAFLQRGCPKTQSFARFSAKGCRKSKPAKKPAGGIEPGTPVLRHRLPEDYV